MDIQLSQPLPNSPVKWGISVCILLKVFVRGHKAWHPYQFSRVGLNKMLEGGVVLLPAITNTYVRFYYYTIYIKWSLNKITLEMFRTTLCSPFIESWCSLKSALYDLPNWPLGFNKVLKIFQRSLCSVLYKLNVHFFVLRKTHLERIGLSMLETWICFISTLHLT